MVMIFMSRAMAISEPWIDRKRECVDRHDVSFPPPRARIMFP